MMGLLRKGALLLAGVGLMVSFGACNGNNAPVSGGVGEGDRTVRIFANFSTAEPEAGDKAVFKKIEDALNVKLQFESPPATNYSERLQLMLVSGDYPDLVLFPAINDEAFRNAVKNKVVLPVNEYVDNAPNIKKYTYDESWNGLKIEKDDKIYGIPRTSIPRNDGFMVRGDWMKNVGVEMPKDSIMTISEFTDMLHKFTYEDPNQNGRDDTYGIAGFQDSKKQFTLVLSSQFGVLGWQEMEGEDYKYMNAMYSRTKDNYKNALAYTQDLYKRKLMDPDSPVNTVKIANERFKKGISGVVTEFAGWVQGYEKDMKETFPGAELTYVYVGDENRKVSGAVSSTGLWGFWSIMKNDGNHELAVSVLDYMLGDEGWEMIVNGLEDVHYSMNDDGTITSNPEIKNDWPRSMVRRKGATEFFVNKLMPEEWYQKTLNWLDIGVGSVVMSKAGDYLPDVAKEPRYLEYEMNMGERLTKIMTGYEEISAYDEVLAGWYANGGEEYVRDMNEYIISMEK